MLRGVLGTRVNSGGTRASADTWERRDSGRGVVSVAFFTAW